MLKKIKGIIVTLFVFGGMGAAYADIASKIYVDRSVETRVSTKQTAVQTLEGKYTVSGTLEVETPTLPAKLE